MSNKASAQGSHKVFLKGDDSDFIAFVDSPKSLEEYKKDSTVPLSDVVSVFKVFTNRTRGSEGVLEEASKLELSNQFGTSNVEDVILEILKNGEDKSSVRALGSGYADTNDANGL